MSWTLASGSRRSTCNESPPYAAPCLVLYLSRSLGRATSNECTNDGSAAAGGATAVEALVAAAVADHDAAAVGARGGVGRDREADLRAAAQVERLDGQRSLVLPVGVPV